MTNYTDAVTTADCPRCGAPQGSPCVAVTGAWKPEGTPISNVHNARMGKNTRSTMMLDESLNWTREEPTEEVQGASSPTAVEASPLPRTHLSDGYLHVLVLNHPAAPRRGYRLVPVHRVVLFEKIGIGPHNCYWCERIISWCSEGDQNLYVDHVNWNKRDNDPNNLVQSCRKCNLLRSPPKSMRKMLKARGWM